MFTFHIKKIALSLLLATSVSYISAAEVCDRRAFNIAVTDTVSINEILVQLSDVCKFSVVPKDSVAAAELQKQLVGINIKDMALREVFNVLVSENNMDYEYKNGILQVSALKTQTFKVDYINAIREGTANIKAAIDSSPYEFDDDRGTDGMEDNAIKASERFSFWETISNEITLILNNGTEGYIAVAPIINQNAGLITVTATKSQLKRVEDYINSMQNRLNKQVILDVSIISVDMNNEYTTGIDWSKFKLGFDSYLNYGKNNQLNYDANGKVISERVGGSRINSLNKAFGTTDNGSGFIVGAAFNFNIAGMVNFLELRGKTKTISSPKVMTLNNQPAIITVGDVINYKLQTDIDNSDTGTSRVTYEQYSSFIGVLLNITPTISDNGKIMLRINPSLSNFKYAEDDKLEVAKGRDKAPDTNERKISTVITANSGDTVILGGLIEQRKGKNNTSVPVLSSIPLVGNLFKSTSDVLKVTELVFVITPRLVNDTSRPVADSLKELGFSKSLYTYE